MTTTPLDEFKAATPVRYFLWSADNSGRPDQLLRVHGPDISCWRRSTKEWLPANWAFDYIYTGEPGAWPIQEKNLPLAQDLPSLADFTDEELARLNQS